MYYLNGELTGYFQSSRGLRQGCSLSPYLFVIVMDVLSKLLDKAASVRSIGYHPRCKNLGLTHLMFADDLMVVTDGKVRSMEGIVNVFDTFAKISGLRISMEKTTMYMGGVPTDIRLEIESRFQFKSGQLPVRYLGLPLTTKSMSSSDYQPLLETIRNRISSWKNRFLSYAGRLELLGSVLWSISSFWLSAFRLPKACIQEIDKICSAFLWSGSDLNPRKAKVAWEAVCRPKDEGGLGLRSLTDMNKVTLLKLLWRLISNKSSLWVRWIHSTVLKNESIWSAKDNDKKGSWMWRKILKIRGLARQFCKVEVYNGKSTSFWFDQWSPMGCLMDLFGPRGQIDTGIGQQDTVHTARTKRRRRNHRSAGLSNVEHLLRSLPSSDAEDVVLWRGKQDVYKSQFISRETWNHIRQVREKVPWHKGLWFSQATPRDRLTTGDRMIMWNQGIDGSCVLCQHQLETRDHLFFRCTYSSSLWSRLMRELMGYHYTEEWSSIILFLSQSPLTRTRRFLARYVFQTTLYTIWWERNSRKHGEKPRPHETLFRVIDRKVKNMTVSIRTQDKRLNMAFQDWIVAVGT